jgi:hypothetical protein
VVEEWPQCDGVVVFGTAGSALTMTEEVVDEAVAGPPPGGCEEGDVGELQCLAGEVAAHESPVGSVGRGVDVVATGGEEVARVDRRRAVDEGVATLDEESVHEAAVSNEDEHASEVEQDGVVVVRVQVAE